MAAGPVDDKPSDTLVVVPGEGSWTGSSTLPHLHHIRPLAHPAWGVVVAWLFTFPNGNGYHEFGQALASDGRSATTGVQADHGPSSSRAVPTLLAAAVLVAGCIFPTGAARYTPEVVGSLPTSSCRARRRPSRSPMVGP